MKAIPLKIAWNSTLPIFASEPFLKSVGEDYGWIGGTDEAGTVRCILPYSVVEAVGLRMARFRVETIPVMGELGVDEEKQFLSGAMDYLRGIGAHVVIPATTNAIFQTYPLGAEAAPYGSYVIDLDQPEESIWRGVHRITRQNISMAERSGVTILSGLKYLDASYRLIRETFRRSRLPFMDYGSLKRYVFGLGDSAKVVVACYKDVVQSCVIIAFSEYCAYAVYGGNLTPQQPGANKLMHWEAIRLFRQIGVHRYDFVGTRIDPPQGSKQEALNSFKRRFGGNLRTGYIWKYALRPARALVYQIGVRILRGGDIVDRERQRLRKREASR